MASILQKAFKLLVGDDADISNVALKFPKKRPLKKLTERELLTLESEIGAQLFGPVPEGRRRDFFCLDADTWIWYEEWFDANKKLQSATIRYEIQEKGILKVQEGARYNYLEGEELNNLVLAINMYYERVCREIYKVDPDTGVRLESAN